MTTKRERILAQIKTNLNGTTGVEDRIYRSRVEALTRAETPAIIVEPISDTPQDTQSFNDKIKWEFKVRVSVIVRGSIPDNIADPTTSFEILEADQPAGVISCEFDIEYRTGYNSLTT
jgi:hypothetical protein